MLTISNTLRFVYLNESYNTLFEVVWDPHSCSSTTWLHAAEGRRLRQIALRPRQLLAMKMKTGIQPAPRVLYTPPNFIALRLCLTTRPRAIS